MTILDLKTSFLGLNRSEFNQYFTPDIIFQILHIKSWFKADFHFLAILRLILEGKMGHSVNLLPEAFGTILDCFMSLDFNNMIFRRVRGGAH